MIDELPIGRLAPSPTGAQHVGNARTYLLAWLSVPDDLPPELLLSAPAGPAPVAAPAAGTIRTLVELERIAIAEALVATGGNKARAAALLGIDRTTLYRKLKDHDLAR